MATRVKHAEQHRDDLSAIMSMITLPILSCAIPLKMVCVCAGAAMMHSISGMVVKSSHVQQSCMSYGFIHQTVLPRDASCLWLHQPCHHPAWSAVDLSLLRHDPSAGSERRRQYSPGRGVFLSPRSL